MFQQASPALFARMAAAFVVMIGLWPVLAILNGRMTAPPPGKHLAPVALAWQAAPAFTSWKPDFLPPDSRFDKTVAANGASVALSILYYRNDDGGTPLITTGSRMANDPQNFHEIGTVERRESIGGRELAVLETTIAGPAGSLLSWHWIRIAGHDTASSYVGKAWQVRERLMLRAGDGAAVIATTPLGSGKEAARAVLRTFLEANRASIDEALVSTEKH
jgi:EpsI family protein